MPSLFALVFYALAAIPLAMDPATLTVGPTVLTAGGQATVMYSDPSRAGEQIVIDIDDGALENKQTSSVTLTLNAQGFAEAQWNVPTTWMMANFRAPDATAVTRAIQQPPQQPLVPAR